MKALLALLSLGLLSLAFGEEYQQPQKKKYKAFDLGKGFPYDYKGFPYNYQFGDEYRVKDKLYKAAPNQHLGYTPEGVHGHGLPNNDYARNQVNYGQPYGYGVPQGYQANQPYPQQAPAAHLGHAPQPYQGYQAPPPQGYKQQKPYSYQHHQAAYPKQHKPYQGKFAYIGQYTGACHDDGFYYNDKDSIVICSNKNAYRQPCAPGTRNSGNYAAGKYYTQADFCDVNLNDLGYSAKH